MKKLLIITGTTAVGKTALAIKKAKQLNGEIISADSRQLYQYLDIVTGKDITDKNYRLIKTFKSFYRLGYFTISNIPVWLYDIVEPNRVFSAYDWAVCAAQTIKLIEKKNKLPILVGGSYFYLQTLLYGLKEVGVSANWLLRKKLDSISVETLQQKLQKTNPQVYDKLNNSDKNNRRRLIRWLEKLGTKNHKRQEFAGIINNYQVEIIGLRFKRRADLKSKIEKRVEKRLKQGALEEIELLLQMGYVQSDPGLQTIGYKQLLDFVYDQIDLKKAKEIWIQKELQYAKRQETFMKKNSGILWQDL